MEQNTIAMSGELMEIEPLRHTPAGIPLLNFRLAHRSQQMEAGFRRQVECELNGIAIGEAAVAMARMATGATVRVEGFLNRKNRMSVQLVLHVTQVRTLEDSRHGETRTEQGQAQG